MRLIPLYIYILFLPFASFGQTSVQGSINMPSLIDLDVNYPGNLQIGFDNLEEFAHGKEYRNCINLAIKSNCSWVVSVKSGDNSFTSTSTKSTIPCNIISLKTAGSNNYIDVTNAPKPLVKNDNDNISNQYNLDLKMSTPWNAEGGKYALNLVFSISPQ